MSVPQPRQPISPRERIRLTKKWAYLVSQSNYLPLTHGEIEERFGTMLDQLVRATEAEPMDTAAAARVGRQLVALNCVAEDSLTCTVEVLGGGLLLQPELRGRPKAAERVVTVLGALAAGYADATKQSIFEQQQNLTKSLFAAANETQQSLTASLARFDEVAAASASGIGVINRAGRFLRSNEPLRTILDRTENELSDLTLFELMPAEEAMRLRTVCTEIADGRLDRVRHRRTILLTGEEHVRPLLSIAPVRGGRELVVVVDDDSELALLRNQLKHQSLHDVLTGLPNRQFLSTRLEAVLNQVDRDTGATLYQLDLDGFSVITDGLGRQAGDQVLRSVADRLRAAFLSERAMIARLGNDEFAVLVENSPASCDVVTMIDRINEELAEPIYLTDGQGVAASATIGVVHRLPAEMSMEDVLRTAELTLRRAQRKGTQWELHDARLDVDDRARCGMAAVLPGAWETGEIRLAFGRQVEMATGRTHAVRAMLRWDRPGHGVVDHRQCVELAERTGLMLPMARWLLRGACEQATGLVGAPTVEISLPACLANDEDLGSRVLRELDQSGLPASRLRLGLPAGSLGGTAADNLAFLIEEGVGVVVEEFGVGAQDLAYLQDLGLRGVRIARWLVERQARPEGPGSIVQRSLAQLVEMAHESGATVAVDGIDSAEQADWWRELGCDVAAGRFYD
ncbi:EAL domain-containing protein [Kutzneria kofuensis]|uniref:Diguanylate cyclase (GGDEF)-like protein n=1 Tax=Kutzneria kofuensis TaxID=103725 RepID=A0A7W9KI15_9PSEU|nr:EAL domain-containing protein [Kutzneria kofuensis]MBB5892997.1 diguanylate cyclase (GGDEF)-like protein [Kutzneria kofuensis]